MKRTVLSRGKGAALSPLAQALKHVAIRGRGALESTAVEDELAMYRAGSLPMDYRPPRDTPWDDTIERWSYAWQYPLKEDPISANNAMSQEPAMELLEAFADRLLEAPPSALPRSAEAPTAEWQMVDASPVATAAGLGPIGGQLPDLVGDGLSETSAAQQQQQQHQPEPPSDELTGLANEIFGDREAIPEKPAAVLAPMKPAEVYAQEHGDVIVAYVDDKSERAQASKQLALILSGDLGLPYDLDGVGSAISALGHRQNTKAARAVFDFALAVGFDPSPDLYGSLMHGYARQGDYGEVMALIEGMKERGVTPANRNWVHLMKALTSAGQPSGAVQVADNMRALANLDPDTTTFAEHLNALASDHQSLSAPYEAVTIFDTMENTYGLIPLRRHYHALLRSLGASVNDDHVQRIEDVSRRMELIGLPWDAATYRILLTAAAFRGDLARTEHLCGKMREEGLVMDQAHYSEVIRAHARSVHPNHVDYAAMRDRNESPLPLWVDRATTARGVLEIAERQAEALGTKVAPSALGNVLLLSAAVLDLALEHLPEDAAAAEAIAQFEVEATTLWRDGFTARGIDKTPMAYGAYLRVLGAMQRVDEAEALFQELVEDRDMTPPRGAYEAMIKMHLASGEEGATSRALQYFEAMQRVGHAVSKTAVNMMVRVADQASYKRDMKRRARRIIQAREEYVARKEAEEAAAASSSPSAAGVGSSLSTFGGHQAPEDRGWATGTRREKLAETAGALTIAEHASESPYAWWERWRKSTVSKHELFADERDDGLPRGESFDEKNAALAKMGITSPFQVQSDVPGRARDTLLGRIRKDGSEPAGALWGLDGDAVYPKTSTGPESWGATFWRERQVVKKALEDAKDGIAPLPPLSKAGNAVRTVAEQVAIERSGARTAGELADAQQFPDHVYDDGKAKPASEFATEPSAAAGLVWQSERHDPLSPYRPDADGLNVDDDGSELHRRMREAADAKTQAAIEAIRNKEEAVAVVTGRGVTKRAKHDYLEAFRDLYRQGSLEAPDEPVSRFGRSDEDTKAAMAAQVRAWFDASKQQPLAEEEVERADGTEQAELDARQARRSARHFVESRKRGGGNRNRKRRESSPPGTSAES